jgi:O-antigen/teichoic acid export membrane protein
MDTLVLAFFATKGVVGIYEASWKVSVVGVMASQALGTAVFPAISNWESLDAREKIENAVSEGFTYGLLLVIPAVVGTALLAQPFMNLVYAFETGSLVLLLLMSEKLIQAPRIIIERTLTGIGKPNLVFRATAATLVCNLILNIALVPTYGMYGAASATISTVTLAVLIEVFYLNRLIQITVHWSNLLWQAASALVMGGVVLLGTFVIPVNTLPRLGVLVFIGMVTYGLLIALNPSMRSRILQII